MPASGAGPLFPEPGGGVIALGEQERPLVVLSCATSIDGYLDDTSPRRLVLSPAADLDRVDAVRAASDPMLVGAGPVPSPPPRRLVRSAPGRDARGARGLPASPAKVTLTRSGDLDPASAFFTAGDAERLLFAATPAAGELRGRPGALADVVDAGGPARLADLLPGLLGDLARRGVRQLLVEGGAAVHTAFLAAGLLGELHTR